jgi:ribosomal protein S14
MSQEPEVQVFTIRLVATEALYHEGGGNNSRGCRKCGDRPKRYFRLVLKDDAERNAFLCRDCFREMGGRETGYDVSWHSEDE